MGYREDALVLKAMADENRLAILKQLCGGEKCACKLLETLNISQPTLSHHMKILCDSGIVDYRKEGKWIHYYISDEGRGMVYQIAGEYLGGIGNYDKNESEEQE